MTETKPEEELIATDSDYYKLEVKESNIPNAGGGVFATKPIKKGDIVCFYSGRIVKNPDYDKSDKILSLNEKEKLVIDGNNIGSLINDIIKVKPYSNRELIEKLIVEGKFDTHPYDYNCQYTKLPGLNDRLVVTAIRDIAVGEELY